MEQDEAGIGAAGTEVGSTFAIEDEDHTLANALRFMLNKSMHVSFCGYSIPHPSEPVVNIRIQTTGDVSATDALDGACTDLRRACEHIRSVFDARVDEFKSRGGTGAQSDDDENDDDDNHADSDKMEED